jgi:hypothetical protein
MKLLNTKRWYTGKAQSFSKPKCHAQSKQYKDVEAQ